MKSKTNSTSGSLSGIKIGPGNSISCDWTLYHASKAVVFSWIQGRQPVMSAHGGPILPIQVGIKNGGLDKIEFIRPSNSTIDIMDGNEFDRLIKAFIEAAATIITEFEESQS